MTQVEPIVHEQDVRSRIRVKSYGEVFTPSHMVERMLDVVGEEIETGPDFVDKTFLEPAAGHGNFLVAILRRKLAAIEKRYPTEKWPYESLFAVASIYGVEFLEDNHRDAKGVMLAEFLDFHQAHGSRYSPETKLHRAAAFLIDTNIVRGNTLTGQTPDGRDIEFSWWNRADGGAGLVKREPFTLSSLRGDALDFAACDRFKVCRIDLVHEELSADA